MAHVVRFPIPAEGHITAMMTLAELLSGAGLFVTFVNTEHVHRRLLLSSSLANVNCLARLPRFRFRTIPDGLEKEESRSLLNFMALEESMRNRSIAHYRELLAPEGGRDPDGWAPVTCVVADGVLPLALEVAEEVGIPVMLLRTSSACSVLALCSFSKLMENGEIPFPGDANMDEPVQGVKGMESFLRRRDLPSASKHAKSVDDPHLKFLTMISNNLARGRALIPNTTQSLDFPILSRISSHCPAVYAIGPVKNLLHNIANATPPSATVTCKEDRSCLAWLDSQPNKSVVYVSFGSVTVLSREAIVEFWHGLVNSGRQFLWVIRPDMVEGGEALPPELEATMTTREKGCVVSWAPQEEVLGHPSVGCFLTHSGWNSTLESIVAGVPMICWPFFVDQPINSRFVSAVWKVGVDMKDLSGRRVVEEMVRKVMEGEEAEELRKSASEMSRAGRRAVEEGGSSYMDFERLVEHIKSLSCEANQKNIK